MEDQATVTLDELFKFAMHRAKGVAMQTAVPWIANNFIDPVTKRHIVLEEFQRRILGRALEVLPDGSSRYNLVIWSQPKKSGKTAIAGAVGAWVALNVEYPNEVSCVANDQEQSSGRIFAAMIPTLERFKWNVPKSPRGVLAYSTINGSMVRAITTNYRGEAGGNQGISLWSELWAYSGERLLRLWEEMTPPPTRKFRMRWVETYAGYKNEYGLLWTLYTRVFKDESEKELQEGVFKVWQDLPVYEIEDSKTLVLWDHTPRMPWQTEEYYKNQETQLRPEAYARLHGNYWQEGSEQFITEELWLNSCRGAPRAARATYALDGSKNGDCTALIGTVRENDEIHTVDVHIWEPINGSEVDQGEIMRTIVNLYKARRLKSPLYYDPYQLVKLAQDLRKLGIRCEEFPQGKARIQADTTLYKLYVEGRIVNYHHPVLRKHVLAAGAKHQGSDGEDVRIIKPHRMSGGNEIKVDAMVAQSMSAFKAYTRSSGGWTSSGL